MEKTEVRREGVRQDYYRNEKPTELSLSAGEIETLWRRAAQMHEEALGEKVNRNIIGVGDRNQ